MDDRSLNEDGTSVPRVKQDDRYSWVLHSQFGRQVRRLWRGCALEHEASEDWQARPLCVHNGEGLKSAMLQHFELAEDSRTAGSSWQVAQPANSRAWRQITWLAIVSWLHFPERDPCGPRSDASAMYHVRTALSVTDPSLLPARAHRTSSRSAYMTLGYQWLPSTNIWKHTCSPSRFETTAHLWYLWFICAVYKFTYLLTYWLLQ